MRDQLEYLQKKLVEHKTTLKGIDEFEDVFNEEGIGDFIPKIREEIHHIETIINFIKENERNKLLKNPQEIWNKASEMSRDNFKIGMIKYVVIEFIKALWGLITFSIKYGDRTYNVFLGWILWGHILLVIYCAFKTFFE